jgi:DnaJ-class molecular chaperone
MQKRTHYEVLGVERNAHPTQIKSQHRRLAKQFHPDLNPGDPKASQQFREVQAAYDVLSDQDKRRSYDETLRPDPVEPFESFHENIRNYRAYEAHPRARSTGDTGTRRSTRPVNRPHQPRAAYSNYTVFLSLQELFRGARRTLTVGQTYTCGRCRGTGKIDFMTCKRCGGYGFLVSYHNQDIVIPPGLQPDMQIRIDLSQGQPEDDILDAPVRTNVSVTVKLDDNGPFEMRDNQIYTTALVPAELLETGGSWTIPDPLGEEFAFTIPPHTQSGTTLKIRKHGLRLGASSRRGHLFCTLLAANLEHKN